MYTATKMLLSRQFLHIFIYFVVFILDYSRNSTPIILYNKEYVSFYVNRKIPTMTDLSPLSDISWHFTFPVSLKRRWLLSLIGNVTRSCFVSRAWRDYLEIKVEWLQVKTPFYNIFTTYTCSSCIPLLHIQNTIWC